MSQRVEKSKCPSTIEWIEKYIRKLDSNNKITNVHKNMDETYKHNVAQVQIQIIYISYYSIDKGKLKNRQNL